MPLNAVALSFASGRGAMAAQGVSKAQYLQRYLSGPPAAQPRRRRKKKLPSGSGRAG